METNNKSEKGAAVIDVAQFAKEGKVVPHNQQYIILIDRKRYTAPKECMTGREILILAGKIPPERFQLNQRFRDVRIVKVGYDQTVCFTEPGLEQFMTIPLDQTEG